MEDVELAEAAADAFSVLSDPLRVRILLALADTRRPDWEHQRMSYSDLRGSVDVEDGGRFNYHLNELCGTFVQSEDGEYWLTLAGTLLIDEIYGGTFSRNHESREGALEYHCGLCGEQLRATVDEGQITVTCPEHEILFDMWLPVHAVPGRSLEELYRIGYLYAWQYRESVCRDVCPHCGGRFDGPTPEHTDSHPLTTLLLEFECRRCGTAFTLGAELFALVQPAAVAFFIDQGLDPTVPDLYHGTRDWEFECREHEDGFLVTFVVGDDQLDIELNRSLTVSSADSV